ncbi:MAG: hypothetical protein V3S83_12465 [Gemmatimonadota bacterium]
MQIEPYRACKIGFTEGEVLWDLSVNPRKEANPVVIVDWDRHSIRYCGPHAAQHAGRLIERGLDAELAEGIRASKEGGSAYSIPLQMGSGQMVLASTPKDSAPPWQDVAASLPKVTTTAEYQKAGKLPSAKEMAAMAIKMLNEREKDPFHRAFKRIYSRSPLTTEKLLAARDKMRAEPGRVERFENERRTACEIQARGMGPGPSMTPEQLAFISGCHSGSGSPRLHGVWPCDCGHDSLDKKDQTGIHQGWCKKG